MLKNKLSKVLLALGMLAGTSTVNADSGDDFKAEQLVQMDYAALPKITLVTSSNEQKAKLERIKRNSNINIVVTDQNLVNNIKNYNPDYICIIGGEDGVNKGVEDFLRTMKPTIRAAQVCLDTTFFNNLGNEIDKINSNKSLDLNLVDRTEYVKGFNDGTLFNHEVFKEEFTRLLNEERVKNGLSPVYIEADLQACTELRASEQANIGSHRSNGKAHTRPDGSKYRTAFADLKISPSECTAQLLGPRKNQNVSDYKMRVYKADSMDIKNEKDIAKALFTTWCNSPKHYKGMMSPRIKSFGVAVGMMHLNASPDDDYKEYNSIVGIFNGN